MSRLDSAFREVTVRRWLQWAALCWSALALGALTLSLLTFLQSDRQQAVAAARTALETDLLYRSRAASKGGLYVPLTEETPPNPHLDEASRTLNIEGGGQLVKVNPAYMTRQIETLRDKKAHITGRMTSLHPLSKANMAVGWEREALQRLERGEPEVVTFGRRGRRTIARVMWPLRMERSCAACHDSQWDVVGAVRGGLTIEIPVPPVSTSFAKWSKSLGLTLLVAWLVGLIGLSYTRELLARRRAEILGAAAAVKESEQRLNLAIQGADTGLWDWNLKNGKIVINDLWARMLGYEAHEIKAHSEFWKQRIHPEDSEWVLAELQRHLEGKTPMFRAEYRLRHRNGEWVWILDTGRVVERDQNGQPIRIAGTHVNITSLKRMELRVRAHARFSRASARIGEMILLRREPQLVNDSACRELGDALEAPFAALLRPYRGNQILGITAAFERDSEPGQREVAVDERLAAGRAFQRGRTVIIEDLDDPDNEPASDLLGSRGLRAGIFVPCQEGDGPLGVLVVGLREPHAFSREEVLFVESIARQIVLSAVTSRTERERELLARAIEQTRDAVAVSDKQGKLLYVNPACEKVTGIARNKLLTMNLRDLAEPEGGASVFEQIFTQLELGQPWQGLLTGHKADGTVYKEKAVISPVRGSDGKTESFVKVGRDVSRELELETQLQQSQKLEAVGQLAAGIAHEINTPTQFVADNTRFLKDAFGDLEPLLTTLKEECLKDEPSDLAASFARLKEALEKVDVDYLLEDVPQAVAQSLEGLERISSIVRAMKDFSHPGGTGKETVDLNRAIRSTVTVARNEWKYVADVKLELDEEMPPVACSHGDFNQVVLNMIVNAAHAIAEKVGDGASGKGQITIRSRVEGEEAVIEIEDTGVGIPRENLSRIFDHFFTTKEVGRGTGQGLAIAHGVIVQQHGGRIEVDSEVGKGTTFRIRLPLQAPVTAPV
ncbi:MAG: PAS domain-containing protein [Acidobacteriota bacterium]|nr:PAS domain-containing protein [Acidobacteriota bacterium]